MKSALLALASMTVFLAQSGAAADTGGAPVTPESAVAAEPANTVPVPALDTNVPATKVVPAKAVNLPPELAEVSRLTESGVSESVVLSYVRRTPMSYSPSADQIIYLRDLGVSEAVLKALVEQGSTATAEAQPQAEQPTSAPAAPAAKAAEPASVSGPAGSFYAPLSPYGDWLEIPGYGWCWHPTVAIANPGWQPYSDNGYWLWSDAGWYWHSYYSWGWAPFHYGRWWRHPGYGWVWCPDQIWGPSWVCWRNWGDYCGWAPLPPGACFTAGLGWTFGGVGVGIDFGFGVPWSCFAFVPYGHFCDHRWFDHRLGMARGREAFERSQVHNAFAANADHHFISRGADPARVEAAAHTHLETVSVRQLPREGGRVGAMPGQLERAGTSQAVYRPGANLSVPANHALNTLNVPRQQSVAAQTSRVQPAFSSGGVSHNTFTAPSTRAPAENMHRAPAVSSPRSAPAYRSPSSYSRPSMPTWSLARPSYSAPRFASRPSSSWSGFSRSAPAYSGGFSGGSHGFQSSHSFGGSSSFRGSPGGGHSSGGRGGWRG